MKFLKVLLAISFLFPAAAFGEKCQILTQKEFTATTASAQVIAANINRRCLWIQNKGSTSIYVAFDTANVSATAGVLIVAGGSWEFQNVPLNSVWIESASSTDVVAVHEGN